MGFVILKNINKGFTFLEVILTMGIISILAIANLHLLTVMGNSTADANNRVRAISAAWVEWNEIASQNYSTVTSVAKTTIPAYSPAQKEIAVTDSTCDGNSCKIVTIKIYPYSTSTDPIFQITQKRLSSSPLVGGTTTVPIGTVIIWPSNTLPANGEWIVCNGQSTSGYPELASIVGTNVPDYQGVFLRGFGSQNSTHYGTVLHSSGELGGIQGDAIRNITGKFHLTVPASWSGTGVFYTQYSGLYFGDGNNQPRADTYFDASRVVPTANEIRPINRAVNFLIKAK